MSKQIYQSRGLLVRADGRCEPRVVARRTGANCVTVESIDTGGSLNAAGVWQYGSAVVAAAGVHSAVVTYSSGASTATCSAAAGLATAAFCSTDVGGTITGTGIPGGTTITAVSTDRNTATLSAATTSAGTNVSVSVSSAATGKARALNWIFNQVGNGKELTFPIGIFEFGDFGTGGATKYDGSQTITPNAVRVGYSGTPVVLAAVSGSGGDLRLGGPTAYPVGTVFRMTKGVSTAGTAGWVPPDLVNGNPSGYSSPLYTMYFNNQPGILLTQFSIEGEDQGHNHHGLGIDHSPGYIVDQVFVLGANPSTTGVNPGECFEIGPSYGAGTIQNSYLTARRPSDGKVVGSSIIGHNNQAGATVINTVVADSAFGHGITCYNVTGAIVYTNVVSLNNAKAGFNHERCGLTTTTITVTNSVSKGNQRDFIVDSDQGSCVTTINDHITDPTLKIRVLIHATYNGVTNKQNVSDVTVNARGANVTATRATVGTAG